MKKTFMILSVFLACCLSADALSLRGEQTMKSVTAADTPFGVLDFLSWNHPWNNYQYPDHASLEKTVALMKEAGVIK